MLNQSEPNVILTAHATKVNRPEPNWTEPQTCLAGRNHAFINLYAVGVMEYLLQRRSSWRMVITPAALFRPEIKQFLLQAAILLAPDTETTNKMTRQ